MVFRALVISLAGTFLLSTYSWSAAQERTSSGESAAAPEIAETDISQLIQDLDANRFSKRQDASRKLKELGKQAIDPLAEAALGESREASSRAFAILKDHFNSPEGELQEAAKKALEKLAKSDRAPIARQADELLNPPPVVQPGRQRIQLGGGQIQIQFGIGGAPQVQQIQVQNANGVKSISINENGRSIKIEEAANKGIKIEVTEKVDGKEVNKKYEAKDETELKKKHPEGYKIYEKYGKGNAIQMQRAVPLRQGIQVQGFAPALPAARQPADAKALGQQLEKISAQMKETQKLLEDLKQNPQQTESLDRAIEQLKEARKALEKTRDASR